MIHRVTYRTKYGANEMGRVYNAPDCDSVAMWLMARYPGSTIKTVEAIHEGAERFWGEHDLGQFCK